MKKCTALGYSLCIIFAKVSYTCPESEDMKALKKSIKPLVYFDFLVFVKHVKCAIWFSFKDINIYMMGVQSMIFLS
jgi:hypothetical protein